MQNDGKRSASACAFDLFSGSFDLTDYSDTIYPESLENVLPGYAISKRNSLMVEWADIVVTYVRNLTGGAAKFQALAEKKGKIIIDCNS